MPEEQTAPSHEHRKPVVSDRDLIRPLVEGDDPVLTTEEIADTVPIGGEAVRLRLNQLYEESEIERKKAGRASVWWLESDHLPKGSKERIEELDRRLTSVEECVFDD